MSILLTGGTGKTGGHLTRLLQEANKSFFVASRDPRKVSELYRGVKFDWFDDETWNTLPFDTAEDPIRAVFLILPSGQTDVAVAAVKSFINLAVKKGVKRFALLSSSALEKGQPGIAMSIIHGYLDEIGVEYSALRPSWFMENFVDDEARRSPDSSAIFSATEDGKIPFVATQDIAQAAFNVLTSPTPMPKDLIVVGPELLSYDDVARALSAVTGRPSRHVRLTLDELTDRFIACGLPEGFAQALAELDAAVARGFAETAFYVDNKFVGRVHFQELAKSLLAEH